MKLLNLKTLLGSSKEKLDEILAPTRAKLIQTKINLEIAQLEVSVDEKKKQMQESIINSKDIDVRKLKDMVNEVSVLELDISTYQDIIADLFAPDEAVAPVAANA